ncbi:conserved hypothetical protein [Treponema primitia ZAS-2]|uniref:Uncharacterized protein n=1 Tax=Treponema primitia (strain ATCC BAA-887 / DSM 12427 / ZAS-2) TaxID=545694 RepID=F5YJI0_TREPZ|nr:hypothetical protein [Treponema primitia]AEF84832.1 conserved hypothetical protein [Treponema primitia ZAS-2]
MAKGQSFLSEEEPTSKGLTRHLNVIITEPTEDMNYLVVPITSYREDTNGNPIPGQDDSCILKAGSHPFLKHKSYVRYKNARQMSAVEILVGIQKGLLIRKEDMNPRIIQEMQRGAEDSPHLPEELRYFFKFFLQGGE